MISYKPSSRNYKLAKKRLCKDNNVHISKVITVTKNTVYGVRNIIWDYEMPFA